MFETITKLESNILLKAKSNLKTIVLPEAGFSERIYSAGMYAAQNNIAKIIFLIKDDNELNKYGFVPTQNVSVINIFKCPYKNEMVQALYERRKEKGLTLIELEELLKQVGYFATMLVYLGYADGMVNGAETTTADSLRPALQIIKGKVPDKLISSFFIMINPSPVTEGGVFVLADCGLVEEPDEEQLTQIVYDTVASAKTLAQIDPRVALLSYSTLGSAMGKYPFKMRNVANKIKLENPDFLIDGEMQYDAATVPVVAKLKAPNSCIKGNANILIFPDLSSGNISYKIMQRTGGYVALGPICQGFLKPVNDVSRGANVKEIVLVIAITCLQV